MSVTPSNGSMKRVAEVDREGCGTRSSSLRYQYALLDAVWTTSRATIAGTRSANWVRSTRKKNKRYLFGVPAVIGAMDQATLTVNGKYGVSLGWVT
jgi:carbohydrate-binding DOMON domain-containing protein